MASTPVADAPKKKLNLSLTEVVPFALCHVVILGAFYMGVTWQAWALCFGLLFVRMWGVTAGYHRYFSHRTYKTSRVFQFLLAFLAQTTAQKGVLWWASHHRNHHKHSDQVGDTHSPVLEGFWYSHMGWLFDNTAETDFSRIQDFAKYPELMWLNKYFLVPPTLLAIGCSLIAGWPGLIIGFFLSTVLCWHITFLVNSLAHVSGKRRFETTDQSRNNWFIAMLTLGEGWHNNHHHYQSSTRQGFYWWEVDITYYVLKALSAVGIVWDLREPPARVLEEGRANDVARKAAKKAGVLGLPVAVAVDHSAELDPVSAE